MLDNLLIGLSIGHPLEALGSFFVVVCIIIIVIVIIIMCVFFRYLIHIIIVVIKLCKESYDHITDLLWCKAQRSCGAAK